MQASTQGGNDFIARMNRALDHIEDRLPDEPDRGELARVAACAYPVFLRVFTQMANLSLCEYIRRRRLSLAACELQKGGVRIIDLALKYGYQTPDAFAAAFKKLHGLPPSLARRPEARLMFYSRLRFTLILQGVEEMNYSCVDMPAFRVLGRRLVTPTGGGTWGVCKSDGSLERLAALSDGGPSLGLCFGFDEEGNNDYMVAFESKAEGEPFAAYTVPASKWLVFPAVGKISEGALDAAWKRIYGEFLPNSPHRQSALPTIEVYREWDEKGDFCHVDIRIPVE